MKKNIKIRYATSSKGFTLLELMVVVAIVAIATTVAVPSFSSLIKNSRIENQANDLFIALKLTRHNAITKNSPSFLCRTALEVDSLDANSVDSCTNVAGANDWNSTLISYVKLTGDDDLADLNTFSEAFDEVKIQTLTPTGAALTRQRMQSVQSPGHDSLTIQANTSANVVMFRSNGSLANPNPIAIAVCDDRNNPENFGRIIDISTSGQIRLKKIDPTNAARDCTPL